eukprot:1161266-Pelagomonas_calceolata.AAC.8
MVSYACGPWHEYNALLLWWRFNFQEAQVPDICPCTAKYRVLGQLTLPGPSHFLQITLTLLRSSHSCQNITSHMHPSAWFASRSLLHAQLPQEAAIPQTECCPHGAVFLMESCGKSCLYNRANVA